MDTSLFDYHLPPDRIAQHSVQPRDQAKMLICSRVTNEFQDRHIFDLPNFLQAGDLLVFNDSKVFRARLQVHTTSRSHELVLLHPKTDSVWEVLIGRSKKILVGDRFLLDDGSEATLTEKDSVEGTCLVDFHRPTSEVFRLADKHGSLPTPPYVDGTGIEETGYQTMYAKQVGSVAAPTAGFHFTPELFAALDARGVQRAYVTLHVGLGTFRPMKTERLDTHVMHEEWACLPRETARAMKDARARGGRVIAVGTTTVRTLETFGGLAGEGWTRLFITPGYTFKAIDGMLTNFHLPKSTLLVLVSAFAGRERILQAYQHAIEHEYRFYSFGDAMLIV